MASPAGDILVNDNVGSRVHGGESHVAGGVRGYAGCQSETGSGNHFTDGESVGVEEADVSCRCCRSGEDSGNHIRGCVQVDISGGPHAKVCRGDDAGCILGDVAAAALQPYSEASGADRRVDCNITCGDAEFQIGARDASHIRRKAAVGGDRANRDAVRVDIAETAGCRGSDGVHIVGRGGQADPARAGPQPQGRADPAQNRSAGLRDRTTSCTCLQPYGAGPHTHILRECQIPGDHTDRHIIVRRGNAHGSDGAHNQGVGVPVVNRTVAGGCQSTDVVGCRSIEHERTGSGAEQQQIRGGNRTARSLRGRARFGTEVERHGGVGQHGAVQCHGAVIVGVGKSRDQRHVAPGTCRLRDRRGIDDDLVTRPEDQIRRGTGDFHRNARVDRDVVCAGAPVIVGGVRRRADTARVHRKRNGARRRDGGRIPRAGRRIAGSREPINRIDRQRTAVDDIHLTGRCVAEGQI